MACTSSSVGRARCWCTRRWRAMSRGFMKWEANVNEYWHAVRLSACRITRVATTRPAPLEWLSMSESSVGAGHGGSSALERGRAAFARKAWSDAHVQLTSADREQPLGPEDL